MSALIALAPAQEEPKNPYFELIAHYEIENIYGHNILEEFPLLEQNFDNESQQLGTLFGTAGYNYALIKDALEFDGEVQGNLQVSKEPYQTPYYLNTFYNEDINTAFISQAALTYYSDDFLISAGRQQFSYDFLLGSVDGVTLFYLNEYIGATLFWFDNYYDFQYNYFSKREQINDDQGVYGLFLQTQDAFENFIFTAYAYSSPNLLYIVGARMNYDLEFITLNGSYTYSNTFTTSSYQRQERYMRLYSDVTLNDENTITAGYSRSGQEGLYTILQLGSHPFSAFYLNNNLQARNSRNLYAEYTFANESVEFQCSAGATKHDALTLNGTALETTDARSFEIDLFGSYQLSDYVGIELSYNRLFNDEKAIFLFDQELIYANVVLQWL